jgi:hypothetical protein
VLGPRQQPVQQATQSKYIIQGAGFRSRSSDPTAHPKPRGCLPSADPSKTLADGEAGWKGMEDGGGAFHDATVTPALQKMLDRNKKLFADLGLTGTPGFVYRDAKGAIHVASGISNKHMFTNMTGLAYAQVNDPNSANIPE